MRAPIQCALCSDIPDGIYDWEMGGNHYRTPLCALHAEQTEAGAAIVEGKDIKHVIHGKVCWCGHLAGAKKRAPQIVSWCPACGQIDAAAVWCMTPHSERLPTPPDMRCGTCEQQKAKVS